jgi:hypothetical protein
MVIRSTHWPIVRLVYGVNETPEMIMKSEKRDVLMAVLHYGIMIGSFMKAYACAPGSDLGEVPLTGWGSSFLPMGEEEKT